jgi:hypothetical protein
MDDVAARAGFIDEAQFDVFVREFFHQFIHGLERAADDAVLTDFV